MFQKVLMHAGIALLALALLWLTLFIPRSVKFPERTVELGYPIPFITLDFSDPSTSMGGAPDYILRDSKFNILSSWEQRVETAWLNYALSYLITLLFIEGVLPLTKTLKKSETPPPTI